MTAQEILQRVEKASFGENFRVVLSTKTLKNKKPPVNHVLWLIGAKTPDSNVFFIDFEQPKESEGLRFLIEVRGNKDAKAFMYLPSTGKTLPLAMDDPSVDLGGTGLTMDDIRGFIPKGEEQATLVKEEKSDGRDCYVLRIAQPESKAERMLWITKQDFLVIKSQYTDEQGKVKRKFRVTEFFNTDQGREFPREEEVVIPDKDTRIIVRQENAVFGIELPQEVLDPAKFGTFQWKK
ncbi:MAG: outer membrane lipoprotein-sorting protein [Desulfomonile tiedjei]|uniref:Outer membrane lipoprotein-sorting protein n=1 Tax=Desulfomonile tiedjei TaxID=2358 RepID=A0A9D6V098_9BACT|nr:outer membrane lipoprotein-sorting protein [Desulfomonile tiedjei]